MITLTNRAAMPCTAEEQIEQAMLFLSLVFDHQDWVEVRLLPAGHGRWFQLADPAASRDVLRWAAELNSREHEPQNVYFGANPRCDTGRRKAADVPLARVLFVDFDGGTTPDQAIARIREAGLPEPTCIIASGGGVHAYWLLVEPITDMAAWTATMKAIIKATGSDKSVHDAPRIMRLPGTANVKPERPGRPMCHIVSMNEVRHPASAFPVLPTSSKSTPLANRAHGHDSGAPSRRSDRLGDEAQRFIDTGKVEGERRPALFRIACDMQARGWTLPEAEAAIVGKVHLITPPLDDEQINDLRRQIGNAFKQDREPGRESMPAQRASQPETADIGRSEFSRPIRRLVLVRASDIECTSINWLWPQRIVGDGLTIVTGPVGISKSLISVDVAARVTTGDKWPDGTGHAPQGSVILFGAEDDAGKVVVPRLAAAGADLERVHVCQGAVTADDDAGDEPAAVILERHIGELRDALDAVADCRLIVFDPLPDYIAGDENNSAEVRAALVPLARLAQERNVAVVAVLHQNKKNDLTTVQRIAGSGAFAQIARVVLSIGTHPEDADKETGKRRIMLVSKNNYGERDVGQAYEIESRSNGQPGLVWQAGLVTMDADEIARRPTGGREHEDRRNEAVDALRDLLASGEKNAATVTATLQDAGLGRRQIDHASTVLNVIKTKRPHGWCWRLPASESRDRTVPQPEPAFAAWDPDAIDQFNAT